MDDELVLRFIFTIVFVIGILSLFGSSYILITYGIQVRCYNVRRNYINDYVWFMSISDFIVGIKTTLEVSQIVFNTEIFKNISPGLCGFVGFIGELFGVNGAAMHFVIAFFLLRPTIDGAGRKDLQDQRMHRIIFLISITLTSVIIPIIFDAYGHTNSGSDDNNMSNYKCYIKKPVFYLVQYIPITIYILCCLCIFVKYAYKRCCKNVDFKQIDIINQMILYTIIFVIQWSPAVIVRWCDVFKAQFGVIATAMLTISLSWIGILNFVVWISYFKMITEIQSSLNENKVDSITFE